MTVENDVGFTEAQVKELKELSTLTGEEKTKRFEIFFAGLNEKQKETLKARSCVYCGIIEGSVKSFKIYEDDVVVCVMDLRPATKGHVVVVPKKHFFVSGQMDDDVSKHVFNIANKISKVVFEAVGAEGTNILVSNGVLAGQKIEHFTVQVIPRFKDDDVVFGWKGVQIDEKEMVSIFKKMVEVSKKNFSEDVEIENPAVEKGGEEIKEEKPLMGERELEKIKDSESDWDFDMGEKV
tara:strand:+ start:740 stop:1450 length:711 start_codon:yes stop_codon:yes gene_type:complete